VVLVRLDKVEVSTFALRETILAVKLELSGDNRVLTPAVKSERSLSEDESAGIRDKRLGRSRSGITKMSLVIRVARAFLPPIITSNIHSTSFLEETGAINK
jgi:hypothetical protein